MEANLPDNHVINASFRNGAVLHSIYEMGTPEGDTVRHGNIHAREGCSCSRVLGAPVADNPALEAQFRLEKAVERFAVCTAVRVVEPLI